VRADGVVVLSGLPRGPADTGTLRSWFICAVVGSAPAVLHHCEEELAGPAPLCSSLFSVRSIGADAARL